MELVKKIKLNYYDLTPKLKQASQSILSNLHEIPFQTIRETAKKQMFQRSLFYDLIKFGVLKAILIFNQM